MYLASATDTTSLVVENVGFGILDIFAKALFSSFIFNTGVKRIYMELALSKRYAEDIVDRSVAPMFVLRCGDGAITRWNGAMAQLVHWLLKESPMTPKMSTYRIIRPVLDE